MIVVVEAMGIHIGAMLSLMTDIPMNVMRKRRYNLPASARSTRRPGTRKGSSTSTASGPGCGS